MGVAERLRYRQVLKKGMFTPYPFPPPPSSSHSFHYLSQRFNRGLGITNPIFYLACQICVTIILILQLEIMYHIFSHISGGPSQPLPHPPSVRHKYPAARFHRRIETHLRKCLIDTRPLGEEFKSRPLEVNGPC